jgi:ATP-dependent DNA helicase RecG
VHGNLFEQVEKTIDLLFTKYITAIISYEGIYRVETYEYPKEAIRECAFQPALIENSRLAITPPKQKIS